jgi:glycosyltransferase involved in cell wall biosynthesis
VKIAIDGFTLGLKEGTGLSTFAYELAQTLSGGGHEVSVVYGLHGIGRDPRLLWPRFVQRLGLGGELLPFEWTRWAPYAAAYAGPGLAGWPLKATPIPRDAAVAAHGLSARIPAAAQLYNLPAVYSTAHTLAGLTARGLVLERLPGIEVFHRTSAVPMRMRGAANVVTVHDVIPLTLPHSTVINLKHYRRIMQAALKGADALFVISEHSRRDLLAFFDVPPERVVVTYQAVSVPPSLRAIDGDELARQLKANFDLAPGGYFLFYGAIEPKKNVMRILDAHAMARSDLPLVIAGRNGWLYQQELRRIRALVRDPKRAGRTRRLEYLPFQQLMLLLKGARALVFPSLYEGFGLPVLEAMQMGVPVITSNTTSLPEVAGDAALLVDPGDARQIADAMDRLAGDDALCADLARRGTAQAARFTPELYLQRLEQGYRLALG